MKTTKKLLSIMLCVVMMLGFVPYTAQKVQAVEGPKNKPEFTVNKSVVGFGGYEWYVIGYKTGVYVSGEGASVTLLAKDMKDEWNGIPFRKGSDRDDEGYKHYTNYGMNEYFAKNKKDMADWNTPNEYAGSTLQQKMEEIAGTLPTAEQAVINKRDLARIEISGGNGWTSYKDPETAYVDGMVGQGIAGQKLWPLSTAESKMVDKKLREYKENWWLRSPVKANDYDVNDVNRDGTVDTGGCIVKKTEEYSARPALNLDLTIFMLTSAAENGKSSATVGGNLVSADVPADKTVKLTMKDTKNQKLKVAATAAQSEQSGSTLSFSYYGATTGTDHNQYISCILTDDAGKVQYYGKLAEVDCADKTSGTLSIPLAGVTDGKYTLQVFSEEINGDLHTDFCSEPVKMSLSVSGGTGTVSEFNGITHDHDWNEEKWDSDDTAHWHKCQTPNCPVTDDAQKDGYAKHTYVQGACTVCDHIDKDFAPKLEPGADSVWHKGDKDGFSFTSNVDIAHFKELQIDGTKHNEAIYDVREGSMIVTLKASDLESLTEGEHKVKIVSETGTVEASFTVAKETGGNEPNANGGATGGNEPNANGGTTDGEQSKSNINEPQTGDNSHMELWIALMVVSLAGVSGAAWYSRKKKAIR